MHHAGDAAYVGANYHTYLPMFLLGGMLFTVLVIHVILFRKLKPVETSRYNYDVLGAANQKNLKQKQLTSQIYCVLL